MRQRAAFYMALRTASPLLLFPATALRVNGLPPAMPPIVCAFNGLLEKIAAAIAMQRNFVADATHELGSALSALNLQLRLAEVADEGLERRHAFRDLHEGLIGSPTWCSK